MSARAFIILALCLAVYRICLGEARQFNNISSFPYNSSDAFWDRPHPRLRVPLDIYGCNGGDHQRVLDAHADAQLILAHAIRELLHLENALNSRLRGLNPPFGRKLQTNLQTFQAIFGHVAFDPEQDGDLNTLDNQNGARTVWRVRDVARDVLEEIQSERSVLEVHCGDGWLTSVDASGNSLAHPLYWDTRPSERQGQGLIEARGTCRTATTDTAVNGHTVSPSRDISYPCHDVISLCPSVLSATQGHRLSGRLPVLRQGPLGASYPIDDFSKNLVLTYLHELAHCNCITDGGPLGDENESYGFDRIQRLAVSFRYGVDERSINNADSFAYFAVAIYLDQYDWSNSWGLPTWGP